MLHNLATNYVGKKRKLRHTQQLSRPRLLAGVAVSLSLYLSCPLSALPPLPLFRAHMLFEFRVVAAVVMVIVGQVHNLTFSQPLELRCPALSRVRPHSFVLYAAVAVIVVVVVVVVTVVDRMPPSVHSGKRH